MTDVAPPTCPAVERDRAKGLDVKACPTCNGAGTLMRRIRLSSGLLIAHEAGPCPCVCHRRRGGA
jgi:hypothetical protein